MSVLRNNDLKNANKLSILNLLRDNPLLSRADISVKLGLSKSTVSAIMDELCMNGWVEDVGRGSSTKQGGKKPILLQINADASYVIAVYFSSTVVNVAITNMASEILAVKSKCVSKVTDYQIHFDEIIEIIHELISECRKEIPDMRILGCGIVIRGLVNVEKRTLLYSATLPGWSDVPVGDYFESRLNLPVFVENDIRAITAYEYLIYKNSNPKVIMCVNAEIGISLGVAINGTVFHGSNFGVSATHMILDTYGPLCTCGNRGCWDTIASTETMIMEIEKRKNGSAGISYQELIQMYEEGDPVVLDVVENYTGYWMSVGIVNAINLYNPDILVLMGKNFDTFKEIRNKVSDAVRSMPNEVARQVQIVFSDGMKHLLVKGASHLVISGFYSIGHHDELADRINKTE